MNMASRARKVHGKEGGRAGPRAGPCRAIHNAAVRRTKAARYRAREKHLAFGITVLDLERLFPHDGTCPLCKVLLSLSGDMGPSTAVIDRIFPPDGYTVHNVRWLCNQCNRSRA